MERTGFRRSLLSMREIIVCYICITGFCAAEHSNSHEEADETTFIKTELVSAALGQALEQTLPQTSGERADPAPDARPHFTDYTG